MGIQIVLSSASCNSSFKYFCCGHMRWKCSYLGLMCILSDILNSYEYMKLMKTLIFNGKHAYLSTNIFCVEKLELM